MKLYELVTWPLIFIFAIGFLGRFLFAIINPEVLLFGIKLGGVPAGSYLLVNGLIGIWLLTLFVKRNYILGVRLSFLYFVYTAIEGYVSYSTVTPLVVIAIILSVFGLLFLKYKI